MPVSQLAANHLTVRNFSIHSDLRFKVSIKFFNFFLTHSRLSLGLGWYYGTSSPWTRSYSAGRYNLGLTITHRHTSRPGKNLAACPTMTSSGGILISLIFDCGHKLLKCSLSNSRICFEDARNNWIDILKN
jgi:hypothetical protein